MTQKPAAPTQTSPTKPQITPSHPQMMGDGSEEQNLNQHGDPSARITQEEVKEAFSKQKPKT